MCRRSIPVVVLLACALIIAGCGSPTGVTYIPEGGTYTVDSLAALRDEADAGSLARTDSAEAATLRQANLAQIRSEGPDAAALADTLTAQFPADYEGVPFHVERGRFEDTDAWIVVEAWGDAGATLEGRRIWVFSADDLALMAAQ